MKKERGCYLNFALMFLMLLAFDDSWAQKSFSKSPNIIFIIADDQGYGDLGNFFQNERAKKNEKFKPFLLSPQLVNWQMKAPCLHNITALHLFALLQGLLLC